MRHSFRHTACALICIQVAAACTKGSSASGDVIAYDDTTVTSKQVIAALQGAYGVHRGDRRNHTKGVCALGSFVGLRSAHIYTRSNLFSGDTIPVVARFSIAGGDPNVADAAPGPRGMALEFRLAGGAHHHMTMINTPMFFARTPRTFLEKMIALKIDPATGKPNPAAYARFEATHPDNAAQEQYLAEHNPPPSYANSAYFGIHTFKFLSGENETTLVRWRFTPQDGEEALTPEQMRTMPHDFLERAMIERMRAGPVRWDMWITIGQPGDVENDPTVLWPPDREQVKVGTLTLTSATPNGRGACEKINYDPLVLSDGIAPSNDPVLLFRSPAYALSFQRRTEGK